MNKDVFTLVEGTAVLQWPQRLSRESFADFEQWLLLVARKAQRSIVEHGRATRSPWTPIGQWFRTTGRVIAAASPSFGTPLVSLQLPRSEFGGKALQDASFNGSMKDDSQLDAALGIHGPPLTVDELGIKLPFGLERRGQPRQPTR